MPATKTKSYRKQTHKSTKSQSRKSGHRWVADVHTESTFPSRGLFTKSASTIARSLASKKISPKGPTSGMRMLTYYINRAGDNLSASRKAELRKAKEILSGIIARRRDQDEKRAA